MTSGRAGVASPIAVIDIGSNSVRLVVYQSLSRDLVATFNEKTLCALGREVQTTGLLAPDGVTKALAALRRYHALCKVMKVRQVYALATAACREAKNGPEFIAKVESICRVSVDILSGAREAHLSALGVRSGLHQPDGIVGDLGGGSLELIDIHNGELRNGQTLPLGGLALLDTSRRSPKRAAKIVSDELATAHQLKSGVGRNFYAVGGTWRALAKLHIMQSGYPMRVLHGYTISAKQALEFARQLRRPVTGAMIADIEEVAGPRRPLLTYAALVLEHIIRIAKPKAIVFSSYGVREGLLFEMMPRSESAQDGLMAAARTLNEQRSRSAAHADELIDWTDRLVKTIALDETEDERRLRHAACLMSDIGWRAHPDYRGELSLHMIINGNFASITHQERIFLAMAIFFRYAGISAESDVPDLVRAMLSRAMVERARLLGAMFRVAFLISAAQPGVLPLVRFAKDGAKIKLVFDPAISELGADRVQTRFKQLARLMHRPVTVATKDALNAKPAKVVPKLGGSKPAKPTGSKVKAAAALAVKLALPKAEVKAVKPHGKGKLKVIVKPLETKKPAKRKNLLRAAS